MKYATLNARAESLQLMLDRFENGDHVRFVREHLLHAARAEEDAEQAARGAAKRHEREVLVEEIRDMRCVFAVLHFLQAFARPIGGAA